MENDGPTVLLGVTGSIAAFRSIDLASRLTQGGYRVDVVLTVAACHFVRPLSFEAVTRRPAYTDDSPGMLGSRAVHIELAERARVVLIAPATADLIGRYACGLAPDLLSSLLLATTAPVVLAPAMNTQMWSHPAVRDNLALLQRRGVRWIGPESGLLSCGAEGPGRLWPVDRLYAAVEELWPSAAASRIAPPPAGKELALPERGTIALSEQKGKEVNEMTEKKKVAKKPAAKKVEKNSKKGQAAKKR
ncbi:flavoprotein [Methylacidimicrobium sp. B4]|uniref:flavoprotein n=1 Tax=Methylacidimicrobium sp. B4 TaxID=2796139 RepID=UPI001A8D892D|nr:flavoprotein [Methylacidimicrobium sp. B4]QSR83822.1 phosphopantothenoylcysteine synthase [Methylacidimicrobium sp. B4]